MSLATAVRDKLSAPPSARRLGHEPGGTRPFAPIVEAVAGAQPPIVCELCGRSLLVGERPFRFSPDGRAYVNVCPLCKEQALELGWVSEGGPSLPVPHTERRRGLLSRFLHRPEPVEPVAQPVLRRLTPDERAMVEAADLFNASPHRRTVEGLARSLGSPRVSVVPLSGVSSEVVISVCWEISWYQYRVSFDTAQPVRLAQRGHDASELESTFTGWNAHLNEVGLIAPDLPEV